MLYVSDPEVQESWAGAEVLNLDGPEYARLIGSASEGSSEKKNPFGLQNEPLNASM